MGIRETLNENPRLTTGVTVGIIVLVLAVIIYQIVGGGPGGGSVTPSPNKAYFTDDDGKNTFPEDINKIPPFDHSGKEAVRAHVYKCDGKTFVNHLERFTPEVKPKLEAMLAKSPPDDPTTVEVLMSQGRQAKRPGDKDWVLQTDPKYAQVTKPQCSNLEEWAEVFP